MNNFKTSAIFSLLVRLRIEYLTLAKLPFFVNSGSLETTEMQTAENVKKL